jgi:hypothetical protein
MTEKDEKKRALDLALAQIEKQYGKGAVMKLGADDRPADVPAISSGFVWDWISPSASAASHAGGSSVKSTGPSHPAKQP